MNTTTKMQTGTKIKRTTDVATYAIATRSAAWMFMRACEAAQLSAGFPSLRPLDALREGPYTVQVGIKTNSEREIADKLAAGAPVVDYAFAGSEYTL